MTNTYIHGYGERESDRLLEQASSMLDLLHGDTRFPSGSRVLTMRSAEGSSTPRRSTRGSAISMNAEPDGVFCYTFFKGIASSA